LFQTCIDVPVLTRYLSEICYPEGWRDYWSEKTESSSIVEEDAVNDQRELERLFEGVKEGLKPFLTFLAVVTSVVGVIVCFVGSVVLGGRKIE